MPILYNRMERINPGDIEGQRYWAPVVKSTGLVKEKEVAKLLAEEVGIAPKKAEIIISQLFNVVTDLLLNGNTVQLGDLGSFRTTVKTEISNCEEEASAAKIKKVIVRFSESNELKNIMKDAKFVEVASLLKDKSKQSLILEP